MQDARCDEVPNEGMQDGEGLTHLYPSWCR